MRSNSSPVGVIGGVEDPDRAPRLRAALVPVEIPVQRGTSSTVVAWEATAGVRFQVTGIPSAGWGGDPRGDLHRRIHWSIHPGSLVSARELGCYDRVCYRVHLRLDHGLRMRASALRPPTRAGRTLTIKPTRSPSLGCPVPRGPRLGAPTRPDASPLLSVAIAAWRPGRFAMRRPEIALSANTSPTSRPPRRAVSASAWRALRCRLSSLPRLRSRPLPTRRAERFTSPQ